MFLSWGLFHKMFSLYGTLWIHSFYDLKNSTADGAILLLETNGNNFLISGFFFLFFVLFSYGTLEFIGDNFLILRIYICQFLFVNLYCSMVFSSYGSHEEEPLRLGNLYPLPLRGQSLFFINYLSICDLWCTNQ